MKDTRVGLLEDIQTPLKDSAHSAPRIVWLKGKAGSGKSTVSHTISARAASEGCLGASFFCSRTGEAALSDPRTILPTIASQLARFDPDFRRGVTEALARDPDLPSANFLVQLTELVVGPLNAMRSESKPLVLIVIDALDECEKTATKHLLATLANATSQMPPQVKILLTSRPEFHIRSVLDPPQSSHPTHVYSATTSDSRVSPHPALILDIEHAADVEADILSYLKAELNLVSARPEVDFSVSSADLNTLAARSGKLFIIAATYARFIGDEELADPAARLRTILESPTPSGVPSIPELDDLYSTVLVTATPTRFASAAEEDGHFARLRKVLGMIILLREQLTITDMELLAGPNLQKGDVRLSLRHLHSVISVPTSDTDGFLKVHHPSFAEFLCDGMRCKNRQIALDVKEHQSCLALSCFSQLAASLTCRFPYHVDPAIPNAEVENLSEMVYSTFHLAVRYGSSHWASHMALGSTSDPRVARGLEEFLRTRLIWWVEIMSLLGETKAAIKEVERAREWVVCLTSKAFLPTYERTSCHDRKRRP